MTTGAVSHIVGFLEAFAAERGASVNTIDAYRRDLADYESYLKAKGADLLKADAACVRGFLAARSAQKLSAASLARRLSAIRQFHKFLYAEGFRLDNPTLAVEGPRRSRPLPKLLSVAEVERLIATAREGFDITERPLRERLDAARIACLIELIYGSGLRVSEALSLKKSIATAKSPLIPGRGKGDKERLVPLGRMALGALQHWLSGEGRPLLEPKKWKLRSDAEMDAAVERVVDGLTSAGAISAIGNRRAFRVGQEPLDLFRRYASVYAREQAYCHFSPALIGNLERNWGARNRKI